MNFASLFGSLSESSVKYPPPVWWITVNTHALDSKWVNVAKTKKILDEFHYASNKGDYVCSYHFICLFSFIHIRYSRPK